MDYNVYMTGFGGQGIILAGVILGEAAAKSGYRAVQTQSLIDMLTYRTHVWRLGDYERDGDDPGELLDLD